jgi:hypothetical protein
MDLYERTKSKPPASECKFISAGQTKPEGSPGNQITGFYAKIKYPIQWRRPMNIVLGIHNIVRWFVLAAALFALFRMVRGLVTRPAWTNPDRLAGLFFTITLDIQLLLGLILYFVLSPLVKAFFADFGTAMQISSLRFWGVEHIAMMVAAAVFGHLGSAVAKKAIPDKEKFTRSLLFFALAILLVIGGIPWFRPLLPKF